MMNLPFKAAAAAEPQPATTKGGRIMIEYPLTIYFDGSCRLCRSEIDNIMARDAGRRLIAVDCSPADFDTHGMPATRDEMMNVIHARDAHGVWIAGVDVFVAAYSAARLGWVSGLLNHPLVKPRAAAAYPWVVRNRYRISALGLHKVLNAFTHRALRRRARDALAASQACENDACRLDKE
jgi:predicted DCC family thiol-disulfide oxidoreductase YuxK